MEAEEAGKQTFLDTFNMIKLRELNELRKENEFCDLTLKCEDGFEIKVHRVVVLSSASNYFKNLLTTPVKEKFEEYILLPDITGDVLEKIIAFIYTSEFEEEIENVEKIVKYAAKFQLQELIEICLLTLNQFINDHTCVKYWRFGRNNLISGLEDKSLAYIADKAEHLFESSIMSELAIEEMKCLLANNRFRLLHIEQTIFEHVLKWAKGKISETQSYSEVFSEVVGLFNYAELKDEFILKRIFFNDDLRENPESFRKIAKLTEKKYKAERPSGFIFHKPTRRLFGLALNKMFFGIEGRYTIGKELKLPCNFGYTTFDNKLLICGGYRSDSCELIDPKTREWKKFPSMKISRWGHQCSNLDNKIYACGGVKRSTVEIFDLVKGKWDYGPKMLAENYNFGLTEVNGALYAMGGETDNVEILDPRTQKWNIVCRNFRCSAQYRFVECVSIGPCIYCFTYERRYIFDTRSNQITSIICCNDRNSRCSFSELDGYIYGLRFLKNSADKYSLNLIPYDLNGNERFKKSYGLYNSNETKNLALVSLYY